MLHPVRQPEKELETLIWMLSNSSPINTWAISHSMFPNGIEQCTIEHSHWQAAECNSASGKSLIKIFHLFLMKFAFVQYCTRDQTISIWVLFKWNCFTIINVTISCYFIIVARLIMVYKMLDNVIFHSHSYWWKSNCIKH